MSQLPTSRATVTVCSLRNCISSWCCSEVTCRFFPPSEITRWLWSCSHVLFNSLIFLAFFSLYGGVGAFIETWGILCLFQPELIIQLPWVCHPLIPKVLRSAAFYPDFSLQRVPHRSNGIKKMLIALPPVMMGTYGYGTSGWVISLFPPVTL